MVEIHHSGRKPSISWLRVPLAFAFLGKEEREKGEGWGGGRGVEWIEEKECVTDRECRERFCLCHICVCVCVFVWTERERDREVCNRERAYREIDCWATLARVNARGLKIKIKSQQHAKYTLVTDPLRQFEVLSLPR